MSTKIGPWPLGLDNLSPDTAVPAQALRKADGVVIERDGTVKTAPGWRMGLSLPGMTGVWQSSKGKIYAVVNDQVALLGEQGLELIGRCGAMARFTEYAGRVIVGSLDGVFEVEQGMRSIGLEAPAYSVAAVETGGLVAGKYGVAIAALRDGQEFALSAIQFVDVVEGGGLSLTVAGEGMVRIYRTTPNGDQLYRAADAPAGLADFRLGVGNLGVMPSGRHLSVMPGGQFIEAWNGRLLVGRGRVLRYSQPLRPALHDPRFDYVLMPSRITMVAPVADGVFVGTRECCYFLGGTNPEDWSQVKLSAQPPIEGCYALAAGSLFQDTADVPVAVWLGASGFVIGLPGGQAVSPQMSRLKITPGRRGSLTVVGRRLYALVV